MHERKTDRSQACLDLPCDATKHITSVLQENGHQYLLLLSSVVNAVSLFLQSVLKELSCLRTSRNTKKRHVMIQQKSQLSHKLLEFKRAVLFVF